MHGGAPWWFLMLLHPATWGIVAILIAIGAYGLWKWFKE